MEISLVIPAYNEEAYVGPTIDAAIKNSHGKFKEIVVVDNASKDRTGDVARERSGVIVLREDRKGTNNARQTGFEHTTAEIVAFIDADTRVPEGWIEKIEKTFTEQSDVVMLSGPPRYFDAKPWEQALFNFEWWLSGVLIYPMVGYMVLGGNCAVRRSALEKIGGLDRSITFYGDDTNLAQRLHEVGKVVFDMRFVIDYSARRFQKQGIINTSWMYAVNYIWHVVFHKPLSKEHVDVR